MFRQRAWPVFLTINGKRLSLHGITLLSRKKSCQVHFGTMQMNRATDYAVRVMIHRATLPSGSKAQLISLVHATGVRGSFLSNVMQRFVHAGFRRGRP
jgi:hypothetical protein